MFLRSDVPLTMYGHAIGSNIPQDLKFSRYSKYSYYFQCRLNFSCWGNYKCHQIPEQPEASLDSICRPLCPNRSITSPCSFLIMTPTSPTFTEGHDTIKEAPAARAEEGSEVFLQTNNPQTEHILRLFLRKGASQVQKCAE